MGLRDRLLMPMDSYQRIVLLAAVFLPLIFQVSTELYYLNHYRIRALHFAMFIAAVLLVLNPKGLRLIIFGFFVYLLVQLLNEGSYLDATLMYALQYCLFGLPLAWLGVSITMIIYIHIGLYAVLAYFAFTNPFKSKTTTNSDVIDQLDRE